MSRSARSTRGIVLAGSTLAATLAVAACTPPMPPDVKAALAESQITCQVGDVTVSAPEIFAGALTAVGAALSSVCTEQTVTEVTADQPAPVTIVDGTLDEAAMKEVALQACAADPAISVPAFAYAVTLAYNVVGLEGLVMSPEIVAGILSGTITAWDDPAIAEANPGYDLSGLPPIDLVSAASGTGAVSAMTAWLQTAAPEAWTAGTTSTLAAGRSVATPGELVTELQAAEGTVGVLPTFTAYGAMLATANLPVAHPEDGSEVVVTTDDTQAAKIGAGATIMTVQGDGSITVPAAVGGLPNPDSFDALAANVVLDGDQPLVGWPVVAYAHMVVCDVPGDPLPLSFAQYLERMAGQGSLEAFGLTPLPEPIRVATFVPLRVEVQADPEASAGA